MTDRQTIHIDQIHAGQPRAYADSHYEAKLHFEGWTPTMFRVAEIARVLIRQWQTVGKNVGDVGQKFPAPTASETGWWSARLDRLECTDMRLTDVPIYATWHVKIVEPYCD